MYYALLFFNRADRSLGTIKNLYQQVYGKELILPDKITTFNEMTQYLNHWNDIQ